ncbi:hypothetical protein [Defluviitalea phaphyphila]|uniref:hypothetical protein n=1 Tax=Defluviitalea phaphyphila TaxID=1473580 RepID=UPI000730F732|nr:hypothetical protein [Defluviitalea phaphyphila]
MNYLNQSNYGLQDIPEPFRGQHKNSYNLTSTSNLTSNETSIETKTQNISNTNKGFSIEDFILVLLIFFILTDYK